MEDALRQSGLALLGEGFQLDSSLNWVFGETIEGEVDVVVPLWSRGRHIVFAQPGAVFWTGFEEEERIDGNFGVVYRTIMAEDVIGGVSLFYDYDFQIGHSRLGVGIDAQRRGFYGAFNYYHPLGDTEDGREGYVEDALRGMDIRLAVESDVTRFGSNVGYWKFEGDEDEDVKEDWKLSYGIDAGLRIIPGVFLEGSLQRHDKDASLGQRASVGLAFKFSLPDFKGKSYGNGEGVSSLHKIVDREKRILYEEREAVPKANLIVSGTGNTRSVEVRLDEAFEEVVVLNLIGSGSATYNDDWTISVGGTDCTVVDGTDCSVTVAAGETVASDDVVITFQEPARGEPAEEIILSVEIVSVNGIDLAPGNPLVVPIPAGEPLPTVSLRAPSSEITEGGMATLTLTLNEELEEDATFNLIGSGGATYGASADWNLSVGGNDCASAAEDSPCEVMIPQGQTTAEVTVAVNTDTNVETTPETFTVSVVVDSGSASIVQTGSPSSLTFTIPADPPLPTVTISTTNTSIMEGLQRTITFTLSEMVSEDVTLNLLASGTADYGSSNDWVLNDGSGACASASGTSCQITIDAGDTEVTTSILVLDNMTGEEDETAILTVAVASGSASIVQVGSPSSLTFTIPADLPLPTLSLSTSSTSITEGNIATVTLTLSRALGSNATFNLTSGGAATYGTSADWNLSVGGTDCASASGASCQVTISAGDTTAEATVEANTDSTAEAREDFTVSVAVDSGSASLVQVGSPLSLGFTIPTNTYNTIKFTSSTATVMEGDTILPKLVLSSPLPAGIAITLVISGTSEEGDYGIGVSQRQIPSGSEYDPDTGIWTLPSGVTDPTLVFGATTETTNADTDNEQVIIQITDPNNNLPAGWNIVEPSTITITITDAG